MELYIPNTTVCADKSRGDYMRKQQSTVCYNTLMFNSTDRKQERFSHVIQTYSSFTSVQSWCTFPSSLCNMNHVITLSAFY